MKKDVGQMLKKTMTTKMAKISTTGAYATLRTDDFGARGGGGRRGKPLLQGRWKEVGKSSWKLEVGWGVAGIDLVAPSRTKDADMILCAIVENIVAFAFTCKSLSRNLERRWSQDEDKT